MATNMLTLLKFTKKMKCEKGFTLMEVLVSGVILAAVAIATYEVLPLPRQRMLELQWRLDVVDYLKKKVDEYKSASFLNPGRTEYCSTANLCDPNVCGHACDAYTCPSPNPSLHSVHDSNLDEIIRNHKTMCYVRVILDATNKCAPGNDNSPDAKQICLFAESPKKQSGAGGKNYETFTAFVFKA